MCGGGGLQVWFVLSGRGSQQKTASHPNDSAPLGRGIGDDGAIGRPLSPLNVVVRVRVVEDPIPGLLPSPREITRPAPPPGVTLARIRDEVYEHEFMKRGRADVVGRRVIGAAGHTGRSLYAAQSHACTIIMSARARVVPTAVHFLQGRM